MWGLFVEGKAKVKEGCILYVLERRKEDRYGGFVGTGGQGTTLAVEAPRVEAPCGPNVLILVICWV